MNPVTTRAKPILKVIGWMNISLLFFVTPLYTADWLGRMAPTLFSDAGIFVIALWGLVYLAVAEDPARYAPILAVLAIEKAFYAITWVSWLGQNSSQLPTLFEADPLAGMFYAGYGLWDGACAVLLFVMWRRFGKPAPATL